MRTRLLVAACGCFAVIAPTAGATVTSTVWDGSAKSITLTDDQNANTFAIAETTSPRTFKITVTEGTIPAPAPAGSNCSPADGGKTLNCDATVNRVIVNGGEGADTFTLTGTSNGNVTIDGGGGADTLTASGNARISPSTLGGAGNDTLNGSPDRGDTFAAEPGNDVYRGGTKAVPAGFDPETFQRTNATDYWFPSADAAVSISLDDVANDTDGLGGTDDVGSDIEYLSGTEAGDTLAAGPNSAYLSGQAGNDTLTGSPAADELAGDAGNDTLLGGGGPDIIRDGDGDRVSRLASQPADVTGDDTIDGGPGDDEITFAGGRDDVRGGDGIDTIFFSRVETQVFDSEPGDVAPKWFPLSISLDDVANDGAPNEGDNVHADVENIDTTRTIFGGGWIAIRRHRGMSLIGGAARSPDSIVGSSAANVITTGGGNDSIIPGGGADVVDAGDGDDQVSAVDTTTDVVRCGRGADNVGADLPGTNPGRADVLTDCENVTGTPLGLEGGVLPTLPVKPVVKLGGASSYKVAKFTRNYTVTTDVTSDQPATVTGELSIAGAKIAKVGRLPIGSGSLKSGTGTRKLKTKVAVRYRKALKRKLRTKKQRRRGITLTLTVTTTNAAGQATRSTKTIRVRG